MGRSRLEVEIKVGIFVAIGVILVALSILLLGSAEGMFKPTLQYKTYFPDVDGLIQGAKVVWNGIRIGVVENIQFENGQSAITVRVSVQKKYSDLIRSQTVAEIATQGVLGDKYISLTGPASGGDVLQADSEIPAKSAQNIKQILSNGEQLMTTLNSLASSMDRILKSFESQRRNDVFFEGVAKSAKNLSDITHKLHGEIDGMQLKSASRHLNSILQKIDDGKGTVGALINDPALYDDAKQLMGGANRNRIMRNLIRQAVKDSESKTN